MVVMQPTPFCNINCRYCYLPTRSLSGRMSLRVLSRIFEALFSSTLLADKITLVWHAGEPLLVPVSFYEYAFQLMERLNTHDIRIGTALQTNGMLITQEWCDFIKRRQVRIGVSLDGPRWLHDQQRLDRSGKGTFERTMRGIELLLANGIMPSIIMVLTEEALDHADEIWQFFADHHLTRLAFNLEEINGAHKWTSLDVEKDKSRYKRFLHRLLELSDASVKPPSIREITTSVNCIRSFEPPIFALENTPAAILSFDYRGNVSTFASELLTAKHPRYGDCFLGNVFEGTLEELLSRQKLVAMNTEVQSGVARCRTSCHYFAFCGGGSPVNKLSENGTFDSAETRQCQLRIQATMEAVLEYLEGKYDNI
jgi:uncharacterized protein